MPFDVEWVRSQLPGRRIEWHASMDSTMTAAKRLAAEGYASGTVVGADEQTAGQGRLGRSWHSEQGSGLYVSFILRHSLSARTLPVLTLALGLAATEALSNITALAFDLRWPNDVLIHGKKCAGILAQIDGAAVIAGIGVNVNQSEFPNDLKDIATSLRIAGGRIYSREQLLIELAPAIDTFSAMLATGGPDPILNMFINSSSYVRGRRVQVDLGGTFVTGITAGLNEAGFLIVRGDDGQENVIVAGGVRPCS